MRDPEPQCNGKQQARDVLQTSPAATARSLLLASRTCALCRAKECRVLRTGPAGPRTLCNECGIKRKEGKLSPPRDNAYTPSTVQREEDDDDDHCIRLTIAKRRKVVTVGAGSAASIANGDAVECAIISDATEEAETEAEKQGPSKIEKVQKACELLQFGLHKDELNIDELKALNQEVLIGLRNLKKALH